MTNLAFLRGDIHCEALWRPYVIPGLTPVACHGERSRRRVVVTENACAAFSTRANLNQRCVKPTMFGRSDIKIKMKPVFEIKFFYVHSELLQLVHVDLEIGRFRSLRPFLLSHEGQSTHCNVGSLSFLSLVYVNLLRAFSEKILIFTWNENNLLKLIDLAYLS
jgi:hypothetical protein